MKASNFPKVTSALNTVLGDRFTTSPAQCAQYGRGEAYPGLLLPDGVAFPNSTEEVSRIAAICWDHRIPMIPSGALTSVEGHVAAPRGGLAINLQRMDKVVDVAPLDLDCLVEAGVTREQLNHELRDQGLFFPVDPGANATIGGMASTRASGTNAVRYGTMAGNVLGLTVVRPDGGVIRTGGRARKSAAGYDLTHLYIGAEGTLGIITEIRLRLYGIPETVAAATCVFETLDGAVRSVAEIIQMGIPVARVEFLDEVQVRACNQYSDLSLPEKPHLFLEFHGSPAGTAEQAELASAVAAEHGGGGFVWAQSSEQRSKLWKARHNAYYAAVALRPGAQIWTSDVCVPISRLPAAVSEARRDIDDNDLIAPIVGHVGDGNFHVLFSFDPADADEFNRVRGVNDRMIERAIAAGGTCTGEHGIGLAKRHHLRAEAGDALDVMRSIKAVLDPYGLMNPGKIFETN